MNRCSDELIVQALDRHRWGNQSHGGCMGDCEEVRVGMAKRKAHQEEFGGHWVVRWKVPQ